MSKRKICVVLVDRANYGRMWPVMREIQNHPALELQTVCAGSMVLERFDLPLRLVEADGFPVNGRVYMELEGSVPSTMAKSLGIGIVEFSSEFQRLQPDILLIIGDRYEALAAVLAASYQNICVAHIQGGEVSGSIDECARHAITRLAQFHFASTRRSAEYLVRMGENPEYVFHVGCPSGDYITRLDTDLPEDLFNCRGVGGFVSAHRPFILVVYHPVTTQYGEEKGQSMELLNALDRLRFPSVWLWPNIDAGSDHISAVLRKYREKHTDSWLRLIKNFEPIVFQKVLKKCACAVGNSSSFIRDTTFSGTPVVLVGDRQLGRESAENLVQVPPRADEVYAAVQRQLEHGPYPPSTLYGDGQASVRIARHLAEITPYRQKRLHYIHETCVPDSRIAEYS